MYIGNVICLYNVYYRKCLLSEILSRTRTHRAPEPLSESVFRAPTPLANQFASRTRTLNKPLRVAYPNP